MTEQQQDEAVEFLFSMRGRYIVAQALYHALKVMGEVRPEAMQEKSNMDDMKYLKEALFNLPDEMWSKPWES